MAVVHPWKVRGSSAAVAAICARQQATSLCYFAVTQVQTFSVLEGPVLEALSPLTSEDSGFSRQDCQQRLSSGDQLLDSVLDSEQFTTGKHLLLAWFDDTGSRNKVLSGSWAQTID